MQPAHPRSKISAFVVNCLDSIIHILANSKISRPYLVSVAEQAGLSLTWLYTLKTWFLMMWTVVHIIEYQQFPLMNIFWTDKIHTSMNYIRSRDVTRKRRHW